MKTIPFTFEDKDYEVRVVSDGSTIYVRAFREGAPANGYSYQVTVPIAFDFERCLGLSAVEQLIETAKKDVTEKAWEGLLDALKQIADYERQHPGAAQPST